MASAETLRVLADALEQVARVLRELPVDPTPAGPAVMREESWRERLWSCDPQVRLGVRELAEALGRPKSWVHRHSRSLPHRLLSGRLVFAAGEVRGWLRQAERIEVPGGGVEALVVRRRSRRAP
jgi:hypothetical protein